ncbi:MAG: apolipoprotein N-acyltransferase [Lentimicrobiaceae bacterium]|nr:apolipoprotein N-acyltransferase [Lentimicrobiaceae bacterium]
MVLKKNKIVLSLLSGVLLWLSWYPYGFTFLIFVAFVPLFILSDKLLERKKGIAFWQGIWSSFPAFIIWNTGVTWWIWNSTAPGAVAAIVLNSFFMSCVFGAWHWVKKSNLPKIAVPLAFIAFWCSWEFLHLNWQITWPWLNLGNVFAVHPALVQWYEYTGTFGGTIWVLGVNFLVYWFLQCGFQHRGAENTEVHREKSARILINLRHLCAKKNFITLTLTIIIPIIISLIIYKTYTINQENSIEAVIVQQNIDPWIEQYQKTNFELAELIIQTAAPKLTPNTALLVTSESALSRLINEEQLLNLDIFPHAAFQLFDTLFQQHPQLNVILGLSTAAVFDTKVSPAARAYPNGDFVEFYNTSCLYNKDTIELYRKSKLVPGVEKMPYPKIFGFLENLAIDLGGTSGSLGIDNEQRVFRTITAQGVVKVGVPICYESVYGELFSRFVNHGAQLMCVITNDAWWGNTPGHKQHFEMSKLRAIETRRYILRAANTGISGFIDPLGNASQQTQYEIRTVIAQTVYPNDKITFYTKYGDYLARMMLGISVLVVCSSLFFFFFGRAGFPPHVRRRLCRRRLTHAVGLSAILLALLAS